MRIGILVYEGFTSLDAVGPYEVLTRVPGAEVGFIAPQPGIVHDDAGALRLEVERGISSVGGLDIVVVSGGPGEVALRSGPVVEWLAGVHRTSTWTTSVCTGSLLLGAAGLLRGVRATTHWLATETLRSYGAIPAAERVVIEVAHRIITAAGVSSGIDMALTLAARLAGDQVAQAIQLGIEYDPQPPFDAGSPEKAPGEVVRSLRARSRFTLERTAAETSSAPASS